MIPIGDDAYPRGGFPLVNVLIIVANVLVFVLLQIPNDAFTMAYSAIPKEILTGTPIVGQIPVSLPDGSVEVMTYPPPPQPIWITLFTSTFLHGGWAHLLGNMLFLFIFGDNVEDAFGSVLYFLFYIFVGFVGSLTFVLTSPDSILPSLGASGAISGVLAAYLVLFPSNRVQVVAFLGWFPFRFAVPAIVMIGLWALFQFVDGFASIATTEQTAGVAYMAHVGGFIAGLVLTLVLKPFVGPRSPAYGTSA